MKKTVFLVIVILAIAGGLISANRALKYEPEFASKLSPGAMKKAALEESQKWDASPDGIKYNKWKVSAKGKKIQGSYDKIKNAVKDFSNMDAVVTSVTFHRSGKSSPIKWLIVNINDEQYMMQFSPKDFQQLNGLKVGDKIIVRSHSAAYSHNHPFLMLSADYIARNNKILFKREFPKNKC